MERMQKSNEFICCIQSLCSYISCCFSGIRLLLSHRSGFVCLLACLLLFLRHLAEIVNNKVKYWVRRLIHLCLWYTESSQVPVDTKLTLLEYCIATIKWFYDVWYAHFFYLRYQRRDTWWRKFFNKKNWLDQRNGAETPLTFGYSYAALTNTQLHSHMHCVNRAVAILTQWHWVYSLVCMY